MNILKYENVRVFIKFFIYISERIPSNLDFVYGIFFALKLICYFLKRKITGVSAFFHLIYVQLQYAYQWRYEQIFFQVEF